MALRTQAYYRRVAEAALATGGIVDPPVPVQQLIESLGIPIVQVNLPQFFTAATVSEDGLPTMVINCARPEHERQLALAHMLGHMLLVLDDPTNKFPRDTQDHSDADRVARELVMPAVMVVEQARLWFNDYRYLARLFGVGEADMLDRMRDLGILSDQQSIRWSY